MTPKLFFVDTGLLCHLLRLEGKDELILSRQKGAVVETFAVSEFLKHRMNQGKNLSCRRFWRRTCRRRTV